MLSAESLRKRCRTCLVILKRAKGNDATRSIPINKFPELERLMHVCISQRTVGADSFCSYAPFLCRCCFDKWMDFSKLFQIAIKTNEKIRKVLEKNVVKTESKNEEKIVKQSENINEYFINNEMLVDIDEIGKYETDSPFSTSSHLNNPINIKHQFISSDEDRSQLNRQFEPNRINSTHLVTQQDDDSISNYYSDNMADDNDFVPYAKKPKGISMQKRSTRKTFCVLKKTYKTRSTVYKASDNHSAAERGSEKVVDPADDPAKKVLYQCEQCEKYFWEKNKYDGHMKQMHEGIRRAYKCEECDKAYKLYKTLLHHKRECHSEKPQEVFKCDICDKNFKTGVILKQHLNNKHSERKEAMRSICDQCGFIAAHQYSLSRHIINKHTETDQLKCDQCPKVFKTQYSLKYHVLGNHNPSNMKPFKCPECQLGFTRKTLLNQHKRTHLKYNERIKCDFEGCKVRFVKHGDKTHHMRLVHLKVKQHICDFCGEAFGAMQTLRHHRFIHTGEKPYNCNVCGQGFRQRTAMKTHRKTHFGKESDSQINNLPEINLSLVNNLSS